MDNKTALFLAIVIVAIFAADHFYFEWGLPTFIGAKVAGIISWLAVWR